jgi:hypothetical protein
MGRKVKFRPLFRVCRQRHDGDCGVASLAMALNLSYEEVLVVASRIAPKVLVRGLYSVEIQLIAEEFGRELEKSLKPDLDTDTGILVVQYKDKTEHALFLTNGLVFEPTSNEEVWDVEQYLKRFKARVLHLLKEED